ncbi:MAG TPA: CHASE2 domain-containing protein, partial [bacterium]|nr:CHASE2 domain-containing protein [bacterium]
MATSARRLSRAARVGIAVTLLVSVVHGLQPDHEWIGQYEKIALDFDYYMRRWLSPPGPFDSRLVVVDIDDKAYDQDLATRPSSWHYYAELFQRIAAAKPKAVFFDVLLNQP